MKIENVLVAFFLASACSSSVAVPEDCAQFDGDKILCLQEGCVFQENGLSWCVKDAKCKVDRNPIGVCYYSPQNYNNGILLSAYREGENLAIQINSSGNLPHGENWKECGEDGSLDSAPEVCKCQELPKEELEEDSCQ